METKSRRQALRLAALGLGVAACSRAVGQPAEKADFACIETSATTGQSRLRLLSQDADSLAQIALDFRAHGMAEDDQSRTLVVFPRRPGNRFAVLNTQSLEIRTVITAPINRHFYGHGAFTADGRWLLTTENDLETLQGKIGVYDASLNFRRVGELSLPGSGPHELIRLSSQDTFAVAVGGLETHPDYGRTAFNLDQFRSQIVLIDFPNTRSEPLGYWPKTEGLSLRHLAVNRLGEILVGAQIKDKARAKPSQSVLWKIVGGQPNEVAAGSELRGYVSSVSSRGTKFLATSKVANAAVFLGSSTDTQQLEGASAAALGGAADLVLGYSTGLVGTTNLAAPTGFEFDNHAIALRG